MKMPERGTVHEQMREIVCGLEEHELGVSLSLKREGAPTPRIMEFMLLDSIRRNCCWRKST